MAETDFATDQIRSPRHPVGGRPVGSRIVRVSRKMPIRPFFTHGRAFGPEDIKIFTTVFDDVLSTLHLDRDDPATVTVAKRIIALANQGERDPARLREGVAKCLSK